MVVVIIVSIITLVIGMRLIAKHKPCGFACLTGTATGLALFFILDERSDSFVGLIIALLSVAAAVAVFFVKEEQKATVRFTEERISVAVPCHTQRCCKVTYLDDYRQQA